MTDLVGEKAEELAADLAQARQTLTAGGAVFGSLRTGGWRHVVATHRVLNDLIGGTENAHIVPLCQQLSLLPMTDALFDTVTIAGAPQPSGFWKMPAGFDRTLAACSTNGPVAYLEADYFGGTGSQNAQVWDRGHVVLGPLHLAENQPLPADGSPISQALRRLGIDKGHHHDEFDAAELSRHRDTND